MSSSGTAIHEEEGDAILRLSERVKHLQGSPTLGAAEVVKKLLAQKRDIVRFDIGEPDFETPAHIKEAGIEAIKSGFTHYTSARGIPELGDALIADQREKGLDAERSNVSFYPGSKFALFSILSLMVDPGDEVAIQDPVWPTYASIVEYLGGKPIRLRSWTDEGPVDLAGLAESKIASKMKAVLINSPCNPTGAKVGDDSLEELVSICERRKVPLILDRIYSALTYDGKPDRIPGGSLESGNFIVVSGFSKEFAMTGWRLGYTIASKKLTDLLVNLQDNTTTCAPSFVQKAGVAALEGERGWQRKMNDEYRARRDKMVSELQKIPGWRCQPPAGAFYCFPRIPSNASVSFAHSLLDGGVSSVAGTFFGRSGEGHLRLSFATPVSRIAKGMERIRELARMS